MNELGFLQPVLANGRDWIPTLILVVFVLLPLIGQFLSKLIEAEKDAARREARQAKARGAGAGGGRPMDPIEREIAEFLRRVQGQADRPKEAPAPPARPVAPPLVAELAEQEPKRRPGRPSAKVPRRPPGTSRTTPPVVSAQVVSEPPASRGVGKRTEELIRTDQIEARTAQLGSTVSRVDEELEAHLREKFDRELQELGRLSVALPELSTSLPPAGTEPPVSEETALLAMPPTAPTGLPTLLATAESVRDAVILYEILQPPWQRWS
ncbi:MAG: hypothetical protein NZ602_05220 [Thermoguttaceae bacterium]|nr:hypothetical protein [Thermoguttaceae bacterium]MDW8038317.1 hypothetical protein [Thermoguttaceae bacterium]